MTFEADATDPALLAADTLGRDMLTTLLREVETIPGWDRLPAIDQQNRINAIADAIRGVIVQALDVLFRGDYPACTAELAQVSFGDGIRATLKIAKSATSRHELADATGQTVVVVMARAEEFTARMEEIKAQCTQKDLFEAYGDRRWAETKAADDETASPDGDQPTDDSAAAGEVKDSPTEGAWTFDGFDMFEWIRLLEKAGAIVTATDFGNWDQAEKESACQWAAEAVGRLAVNQIPEPPPPHVLHRDHLPGAEVTRTPTFIEQIETLTKAGVDITDEEFEQLTGRQRKSALAWANRVIADPSIAPAPPNFLRLKKEADGRTTITGALPPDHPEADA